MATNEELEQQIQELKKQAELHWQVNEEQQNQIKKLQEEQHKKILAKQENHDKNIHFQSGITSITLIITGVGASMKMLEKFAGQTKDIISDASNGIKKAGKKGQEEKEDDKKED